MPLQDTIHKITEGSGSRFLTLILVFFGMVAIAVWYNIAAFKNLSTIEGMDNAQLARSISEGNGFKTRFLRPLGLHLIRTHTPPDADSTTTTLQPDLANAPIYPFLLAGALKAMPFNYPDTTSLRDFSRYAPDLWIAIFNQLIFFVAVWMVFRLGRRLFDEPVAWVAAAVFAGADLFWRFSISGLSTLLLIVEFLALIEVLSRMNPVGAEEAPDATSRLPRLACVAGLLAGLACLTRYGFGAVIIAVIAFVAELRTPRRPLLITACIGSFLLVTAPWVIRNYLVSGTAFGTAGYAVFQTTPLFEGLELERTLNPEFSLMTAGDLWHKLVVGLREIITKDLPRLGGSWVSAFFLVGLLVPFRNPTLNRLRGFILISLTVLALTQAMGRTGLTAESPDINSENLLVVIAPAVFLFGVAFFFVLVDQLGLKLPGVRGFSIGAFIGLACAPLVISLFMPVRSALAYPPYYPPAIQEKAAWLAEDDIMMSDFPWAVAWYGHRQSVWLSLNYNEEVSPKYRNDFKSADDALREFGTPIRGLYLSTRTLKSVETASIQAWIEGEGADNWEESVSDWQSFVLIGVYLHHEIPDGFPLKQAPFGLLPELFLSDSERN